MKIAAKAISMRAEGIDVVDFSVGEPDFPTPEFIKEAAIKAIQSNKTKYTQNRGMVELREAIVHKLKTDNGLDYNTSQIIVSNGAKQSVYNAIMAIVDDGDEVIIPAPYWVSYPEMVRLSGGRPVIIQTLEENGFKLKPEQLTQAISSNTKLLILCSPSNPTGAAYTRDELLALADVIRKENLFVIADEIYEKLVFDDFNFTSFASLDADMYRRTILINGVSKSYSMTGWRIGYAAGPADIITACDTIQSHATSNASSISQYAATAGLNGPQFEISRMKAEFEKRRNYLLQRLSRIEAITCATPQGAFYVFPNVKSYFGKETGGTFIRNSYGLAYYLLREANVALVPGAAFGSEGFLRISYSTSMEQIAKGMDRMEKALSRLKTPFTVKERTLNNTITKHQSAVLVENQLNDDKKQALLQEAESHLRYDQYFEWNANINGSVIQLRTNNGHLYDFWMENWYPAQLETDIEPHGIIYALSEVTGREPYIFFHGQSRTAFLFNSDYYQNLYRLAVGMATEIGNQHQLLHQVRAMSVDFKGKGILLIGPKGTGKQEIFLHLLEHPETALHSPENVFIRYGGGYTVADVAERKFYWPADTAHLQPALSALFDRSKCENIITDKEKCTHINCSFSGHCELDRGLPYCYGAGKNSRVMLDPYWLGGMQKHVKRTEIQAVFILQNDALRKPLENLSAGEAMQYLENGQAFGPVLDKQDQAPFYNPLNILPEERFKNLQTEGFRRLTAAVPFYLINSAGQSPSSIAAQIIQLCR